MEKIQSCRSQMDRSNSLPGQHRRTGGPLSSAELTRSFFHTAAILDQTQICSFHSDQVSYRAHVITVAVFKFSVLKSITGSTFHCSWAKSRSWAAGLVHSGDSIAQTNENLLMFMWEGMDTFYSSVSAD